MTHKLGRLPDTSAQSIMKREFGFTQKRFVQLVISVCHANAKRPKSRPTKTPRSHPTSCLSAPAALQSGARLDSSLRWHDRLI